MGIHPPYARKLLAATVLVGLALAGCDDSETIIFIEDNPPAVPSGVYTITGDGWVEIRWNPVREEDVAGYGVYKSDALEGAYLRIATLQGLENDSYVDHDVVNGTTYFYAVDAFDFAGHESDLSFEDAFDTPRPAGANVTVFARQDDAAQSGIDLSDFDNAGFVTAWNAPDTNIFFQRIGSVLYAKGTLIGGFWNDLQDLGYTESMDDVSWAPIVGWSVSPDGVELIEGHTYVVWTHDSFFAKFRVTAILGPSGTPSGARIDWAYQIDPSNPELSPHSPARGEARVTEGRDS